MKGHPQPKPRPGDLWEVLRPGKRKLTKEVGDVRMVWAMVKTNAGPYLRKRVLFVYWKRLPKGRYTGMSVNFLMARGRRLTTKAQRDRAQERRFRQIDERLARRMNNRFTK